MKYGETLRQRSIPAWRAYNIDYDDIKLYIKEQTTPGKGKSVSIPGRGMEKSQVFEDDLFQILSQQHERIALFVKSKAREIQHRLDDAKKRLRQLAKRSRAADSRIPVSRLERYGRLENDVLKAGDEIKSLARFTSIQRTAFRKLLKKYKKWTGSMALEGMFRAQVLDDKRSFTNFDLGPLLDDYSETLRSVRALYESKVQQPATPRASPDTAACSIDSAVIAGLQTSLATDSKAEFDTAIATLPLGLVGTLASYFVHPDNVVELQVLLLHHMQYYTPRSRCTQSSTMRDSGFDGLSRDADYHMLAVDNADRLAQEQSALTVNDREGANGATPQRARLCARWNADEEALVSAKTGSQVRVAALKKKRIATFFDKDAPFPPRRDSEPSQLATDDLMAMRGEYVQDPGSRPLYVVSCNRSRLVCLDNNPRTFSLATLDTNILLRDPASSSGESTPSSFPFTILMVRQEGMTSSDLVSMLDRSHLLERVRGFSLHYHALWQVCKPTNVPAPFWIPMLSRDIRKLPPPALKRGSFAETRSGSQSANASSSAASVVGATDSTTAVETNASLSAVPGELETPRLKSFRRKRRRTTRYEGEAGERVQGRYWSEYDHPEELGGDAGDAFVIYIDPNERSMLDRLFDKLGAIFGRRRKPQDDEETLIDSPASPEDDETSSSDEDEDDTPKRRQPSRSYGAIPRHLSLSSSHPPLRLGTPHKTAKPQFLPQLTSLCLSASLVILASAYIIAMTGGHKYAAGVDAGVVFATGSSLVFAAVGLAALMRRVEAVGWGGWCAAGAVVVLDAVGSGGLLARVLG